MVAAGKQPPPPPQSMRRSLLLLGVVLLPGCAVPAPPGYAPLSTTVCSAAGAAALTAGGVPAASGGSSVMPALPRRDRTGASISSDLGTYTIVNCGAGAGSGALPCALAPLPPVSSLATAAGAPNTVIQYASLRAARRGAARRVCALSAPAAWWKCRRGEMGDCCQRPTDARPLPSPRPPRLAPRAGGGPSALRHSRAAHGHPRRPLHHRLCHRALLLLLLLPR